LAKFIVLRNGVNHRVFDFDGNIARVGSGTTVDLQLETPGIEGDLFFLTKQSAGYEIERRARSLELAVNGAPVGEPTILQEGDKIGFLDYIMIVTYQAAGQPQPAPPPVEPVVPKVAPPQSTAPVIPVAEPKREDVPPPPPPPPLPPKPVAKGGERPTVIIDSQALAAQAQQERVVPQPPRDAQDGQRVTKPAAQQSSTPSPEPPRVSKKQKITPVYTLCVLTGQHKGRAFEIDTPEFMIGRERSLCDLVLDHDEQGQPETSLSREHCVITSTNEGLYLTDKRSQLRTFINRKIIEPGQREFIAPEDIISIPAPSGEVFMRLCFRGQENFAPVSFAGPIHPKWIMILGAAIVVLIIALILLLR
jgi:hypothetical protein